MSLSRLILPLGLGAAALIGAAVISVTPSYSADPPSRVARTQPNVFDDAPVKPEKWTGIIVSGFYGYGALDGEITGPGFSFDGLSATGNLWGLDLGARYQIPGSFLVVGARGGYTWSDQALTVTPGGSAGIDKGWHADAILGAGFGTAMPYVGVGHTVMQTHVTGAGSTPDLKGTRGILGVEFRLPKLETSFATPTLALEVIYTDYSAVNLGGPVNLNVSSLDAMARLNIQLWK